MQTQHQVAFSRILGGSGGTDRGNTKQLSTRSLAHSRYSTDTALGSKGVELGFLCSVILHEPNPLYRPRFPYQQTAKVRTSTQQEAFRLVASTRPPPLSLDAWGEEMGAGSRAGILGKYWRHSRLFLGPNSLVFQLLSRSVATKPGQKGPPKPNFLPKQGDHHIL